MRRATLTILTYLSLLASIGSFVISGTHFLAGCSPNDDELRSAPRQVLERREQAPAPYAGNGETGRSPSPAQDPRRLARDALVEICLGTIVVCTLGILVIHLLRRHPPAL